MNQKNLVDFDFSDVNGNFKVACCVQPNVQFMHIVRITFLLQKCSTFFLTIVLCDLKHNFMYFVCYAAGEGLIV